MHVCACACVSCMMHVCMYAVCFCAQCLVMLDSICCLLQINQIIILDSCARCVSPVSVLFGRYAFLNPNNWYCQFSRCSSARAVHVYDMHPVAAPPPHHPPQPKPRYTKNTTILPRQPGTRPLTRLPREMTMRESVVRLVRCSFEMSGGWKGKRRGGGEKGVGGGRQR